MTLFRVGRVDDADAAILAANDLAFELEAGYTITRDDVTAAEWAMHRFYCQVREEYREAVSKQKQMEAENSKIGREKRERGARTRGGSI
jgi:phage terminase small subunit